MFRKPEWSPERLRGQMYTCHLSVLRASLVREVGGFREGYEGSQDHDLVLRVTERSRRVVHIPEVLYHWRTIPGSAAATSDAKPYAAIAGRKAVQDQFDRLGLTAEVTHGVAPGLYVARRPLDPSVSVSIVIPTNGSSGMVWGRRRVFVVEAVQSALAATRHEDVEVVVVHDTSTPPEVLDAAGGGRRRPPHAGAVHRALQLQPQDEPRRAARHRGPHRLAQRRRRGDHRRLARAAASPRSTSPTSA